VVSNGAVRATVDGYQSLGAGWAIFTQLLTTATVG
jgi:hypothetical protein